MVWSAKKVDILFIGDQLKLKFDDHKEKKKISVGNSGLAVCDYQKPIQ